MRRIARLFFCIRALMLPKVHCLNPFIPPSTMPEQSLVRSLIDADTVCFSNRAFRHKTRIVSCLQTAITTCKDILPGLLRLKVFKTRITLSQLPCSLSHTLRHDIMLCQAYTCSSGRIIIANACRRTTFFSLQYITVLRTYRSYF